MARRRMTVKRIDPWSVLKFGFLANIVLLVIGLMILGVVWFIVDRLQLIDQACGIVTDVGFSECGLNAGNLFRSSVLLGMLGVVVQTAVLVFLSFLYNLISDLTGGLGITVVDDSIPESAKRSEPAVRTTSRGYPASRHSVEDLPTTSGGSSDAAARTSEPVSEPMVRADASKRSPAGPRSSPASPRSEDDLFGGR